MEEDDIAKSRVGKIPSRRGRKEELNMRIVGVPTKTLSELEALFIYRFYKDLGNTLVAYILRL